MSRPLTVFALALLALLPAACARGPVAPNFTLTDDGGKPWALADQHGKPVLLTFGFTHCTDTCPATLAKLARMTQALGGPARNVEIAFVTVDPHRDTPPVMHAFVQRFSSGRIVGLTGTPAQIAGVENAYHVWAQRIPGKHGGDDYDEAHSAVVYFIDAGGHIRALRNDDDSQAELARTLRETLG